VRNLAYLKKAGIFHPLFATQVTFSDQYQLSMGATDHNDLHKPLTDEPLPPPRNDSLTSQNGKGHSGGHGNELAHNSRRSHSGMRLSVTMEGNVTEGRKTDAQSIPKRGLGPRPVGGSEKLGMFSGVFVPTCLNVLSILMFLRFGFILGKVYSVLGCLFIVQC
jgi:hypothetical protein